ncbi:NTP transferase domain-containing protein [Pseudarthrobacter sp. C4D7]|nr:NTP transferase domain-containing protein [Pseudarthrobacter sp. C4D7]NUT71191.1 NTP transferase domain-containing protein [Pseudarthrobacter sp. C4D7]
MVFDAVILAGGRSSRLGGVPKQSLVFQGETLLERAVAAADGARRTVIVGDGETLAGVARTKGPLTGETGPPTLLTCREEPPFAGPAAAIAAGLAALSGMGEGAPYCLVLACDMPLAARAVAVLKDALEQPTGPAGGAGVMACAEDGRMQPLAGFYSTHELRKSCQDLASRNALVNGSVRSLLASLDVQLVTVPAGSTSDVDTWDDAAALGIAAGSQRVGQDRRTGGANVGGTS